MTRTRKREEKKVNKMQRLFVPFVRISMIFIVRSSGTTSYSVCSDDEVTPSVVHRHTTY